MRYRHLMRKAYLSGLAFGWLMSVAMVLAAVAAKKPAPPTVHVNDIAQSPEKFKGKIGLVGVVAQVSEKASAFLLIDKREWEACRELNCASHAVRIDVPATKEQAKAAGLEALYTGTLPKPEDEVTVAGTWEKHGKIWRLAADEVRKGGNVIMKRKGQDGKNSKEMK